jgi:cob(I)alamin adenosyltransferase
MKIYTRTGDKGTTALIGGRRVSKNHKRIEAYGTVDELMAFTGLLHSKVPEDYRQFLIEILDRLMTCASVLATDCTDCKVKLPEILESDIQKLENEMDSMDKTLKPLSHFVLPAGNEVVSYCHVCRTICRRSERLAISVSETESPCEMTVKYLNRLSDYFFVLSRMLTCELNVDEIIWLPRT